MSVAAAPPKALFAERVHRIGTEAAFAFGALIREVEADGERVIRCNIGQPDFPLPEHIKEAVKKALDDGLTTYCDPQGIPELRSAVARSVGERTGLDIDPNRVVVYPGGRPPIGFAHMAYSQAGAEVIYPSPGYPLFESFIPYFRCTPVPIVLREEEDFGLTRKQLEPLISPRTGLIFLNFPSNPTGGVATREQLEELSEVILERTPPTLRVYSDESYEAITFDGDEHISIASMPGMEARTIIASGVSKTYAWTGGRVGWAVYPTVKEAMVHRKLTINYVASIPPYNQWGAIEALESPRDPGDGGGVPAASGRRRRGAQRDRRGHLHAAQGGVLRLPERRRRAGEDRRDRGVRSPPSVGTAAHEPLHALPALPPVSVPRRDDGSSLLQRAW